MLDGYEDNPLPIVPSNSNSPSRHRQPSNINTTENPFLIRQRTRTSSILVTNSVNHNDDDDDNLSAHSIDLDDDKLLY